MCGETCCRRPLICWLRMREGGKLGARLLGSWGVSVQFEFESVSQGISYSVKGEIASGVKEGRHFD
jgi:hypothetical protein